MNLTLDTAFKKRISARLESAEEGKCAAGPARVDEVEALQQPVIRHLPLELLERPAAPGGENPELVSESPAEGAGASV